MGSKDKKKRKNSAENVRSVEVEERIEKKQKKKSKLKVGLEPKLLEDDNSTTFGPNRSKFARALASVDWHTRERAMRTLQVWLSNRSEAISQDDLRKLWKGIFFCYWHSDKTQVQMELAERLSSLVHTLPQQVALTYYGIFLDTMAREWSTIDKLRLDKFMSLVRFFLNAAFQRIATNDWHPDVVIPFTEALNNVLTMKNKAGYLLTGLLLHVAHIYLDELERVCSVDEDSLDMVPGDVLSFFLEPFKCLLTTSTSKAVLTRVHTCIYEKVLGKCRDCLEALYENEEKGSNDGYAFAQLDALDMTDQLFAVAADENTRQANRELLYDVISQSEKLAEFQSKLAQRQSSKSKKERGRARRSSSEKANGKGISSHKIALDKPNAVDDNSIDAMSKVAIKNKDTKRRKKGVHFKLSQNQIFKFNKRSNANVSYSPSRTTPIKGALKR